MTDFCSFQKAEQLLEDEIVHRQKMLISIGEGKYESLLAEQEARECLADEIAHFISVLSELKAQSYCDCCEKHLLDMREAFRVSLTYWGGLLPNTNLKVARVLLKVLCANCICPPVVSHSASLETAIGGGVIGVASEALSSRNRNFATRREVDQAIKLLTPADQRTLQRLATRKGWAGRANHRWTSEDLFEEGIRSTLEGAQGTSKNGRHWDKSVDFMTHLSGAMQSIADHWKLKYRKQKTCLEAELFRCDEEGKQFSSLDAALADPNVLARASWIPSPAPLPDQSLIAYEKLARIPKNDYETRVVQGLSQGMGGLEVMQTFELTHQQYRSARKKIGLRLSDRRNGGSKQRLSCSQLRYGSALNCISSTKAVAKAGLIIHYDKILVELLAIRLREAGYKVNTACGAEDGVHSYAHHGPFTVLLINHDLPKKGGVEVALEILDKNPSQRMIITAFDYETEEEVGLPERLMGVPILMSPSKKHVRKSLETVENSAAECWNQLIHGPVELPERVVAEETQLIHEAS